MDVAAEIKKALKEALGENPNLPITATVVSVEGSTCTVSISGGLKLSDVRLKSTISDSDDGFYMVPKVGSEVIMISQTGKLNSLIVIKQDQVDQLFYKVDDFEFVVDAQTKKLTLKKAGVNFGSLIGSLIDTIKQAVIDTPNGPGSINAVTQTQLTTLKTQFNSILNSN